MPGEARRAGRDVAVGAHEALRAPSRTRVAARRARPIVLPRCAMGRIQSWPSIRRPASSASRCSRTGSPSARCARGRGPGSARWRRSRSSSPPTARTRSTGSPRASTRQQALGELLAADPLAARPPGRGDRRRAATIGVHTGPDCIAHAGHVTGEHCSCQANMMARDTVPAGDVGGVRERHRARSRTACWPRSTPPRARAATSAGASRRRWSSCPPRASRGGGRVDLRVEDHDAPLDELRRLLALQRAYDLAGAGDELLAAGRTDEAGRALPRGGRARARTRDELLFWSGLAHRPGRRPRRRRGRGPAGGRGEPELAGPPRPALTGVRPGRRGGARGARPSGRSLRPWAACARSEPGLAFSSGCRRVLSRRRDGRDHEHDDDHDQREADVEISGTSFEMSSCAQCSIELDADEREDEREPGREVDEPVEQAGDEEVQRAQAEQREGVGGEDDEGLVGDAEDGRDRVQREQQVGACRSRSAR